MIENVIVRCALWAAIEKSKGPSDLVWVPDFHMSKVCPTLEFRWPCAHTGIMTQQHVLLVIPPQGPQFKYRDHIYYLRVSGEYFSS